MQTKRKGCQFNHHEEDGIILPVPMLFLPMITAIIFVITILWKMLSRFLFFPSSLCFSPLCPPPASPPQSRPKNVKSSKATSLRHYNSALCSPARKRDCVPHQAGSKRVHFNKSKNLKLKSEPELKTQVCLQSARAPALSSANSGNCKFLLSFLKPTHLWWPQLQNSCKLYFTL